MYETLKMEIEIGKYYVNKTWRFLLPFLKTFGESLLKNTIKYLSLQQVSMIPFLMVLFTKEIVFCMFFLIKNIMRKDLKTF